MSTPVVDRGYIDIPGSEAGRVFACEVAPPDGIAARGSALLIAPLFEEKKSSRRTLHELALSIAEVGWRSLSVDFTGTGDSPGDHSELTVELMLKEVEAARAHLRERSSASAEPVLLGLRLGAAVAWISAARGAPAPGGLVLVQPVPEGRKYLWNMLRRKQVRDMMTAGKSAGVTARAKEAFEAGGSFDLDGFEVSAALARGLEEIDLASEQLPAGLPSLLIGCGPKGRAPADVAKLREGLSETGKMVSLDIEPFWDRIERTDSSALHLAVREFLDGLEGGAG